MKAISLALKSFTGQQYSTNNLDEGIRIYAQYSLTIVLDTLARQSANKFAIVLTQSYLCVVNQKLKHRNDEKDASFSIVAHVGNDNFHSLYFEKVFNVNLKKACNLNKLRHGGLNLIGFPSGNSHVGYSHLLGKPSIGDLLVGQHYSDSVLTIFLQHLF